MAKKHQTYHFTHPLIIAFILGSFLLALTQIPRFAGATDTSEASANSARQLIPAQSSNYCPQVMHLCPDGREVPLLPENRCQPRCPIMEPTASLKVLPSPRVSRKPRPTLNPTMFPNPSKIPFPSASAICNPRYIPDIACLGGMPLEIDPITCTYRCRDYRELSQ